MKAQILRLLLESPQAPHSSTAPSRQTTTRMDQPPPQVGDGCDPYPILFRIFKDQMLSSGFGFGSPVEPGRNCQKVEEENVVSRDKRFASSDRFTNARNLGGTSCVKFLTSRSVEETKAMS